MFEEKIDAIEDAVQRLRRLDEQLSAIVPTWSRARVLESYQAIRGASFQVAVIFAAEVLFLCTVIAVWFTMSCARLKAPCARHQA